MTAKLKCPRCESTRIQELHWKGKVYPQCSECHFWSTKPWYIGEDNHAGK